LGGPKGIAAAKLVRYEAKKTAADSDELAPLQSSIWLLFWR